MSALAIPTPARPDRPRLDEPVPAIRRAATESSRTPATPTPSRHGRGGRVLFEVPFHSAMNNADLARLARTLDLSTHMVRKMRPSPNSPGVARLDHFSGLFLERGGAEGEWLLEARTWGNPAPESVHEWHLLAAGAARQLDPTVTTPEPLPFREARVQVPDRPVGEVLNRRLAGFRRRLVGLS